MSTVVDDIGYQAYLSVYFLGIMLLIANLISSLINKRAWTLGLLTIVAIIYFIGWAEDFSHQPLTTILFLLIGFITIYSRFLLNKVKGMIKL